MSKRSNSNDSSIGCVMYLLLAVFAMPLVGGYLLLAGKNGEQKMLGAALLIVGIIVWVKLGLGS